MHWETQGSSRNIKEAMFIHVNDSSLNRDLGKYQLPHIWDNILQDTPALQVKQSSLTPSFYWDPLSQVPQPPNSSPPIQRWGAHVHLLVSIQMGVPKHPQTSLHPFLCPHSSLYSSTI